MTELAGRGSTTVADKVVRKIAEQAAAEALSAGRTAASGSATVQGRRAEVTLRVALPYPAPLAKGARHVQEHVMDRTRHLTGLEVVRPRLAVTRLTVQGPAVGPAHAVTSAGLPTGGPSAPRTPRRWWSPRRFPMAVLILLVGSLCGAVTADVIRVHALGVPAGAWRMGAVEWLAGQQPGDPAVTGIALVASAAGLWVLALALTPGRRGRLGVTSPAAHQTVAVDRSTVASLVRDAVGDVEGIEAVRVRVGRRRLSVRARLAFGDRDDARQEATAVTERILANCLLRRTPRQRVTVTPQPTWQPPGAADHTPDEEKGLTDDRAPHDR
ncbi:DUF6286 domain-containing Asp23/Gls24 family envelope stress response protein [Streptomyces sp. NPDC101733]|uniref:DUF6286 domain-containing Asp23/Gls24 family envelope stress response protein n=1 Tax=unclassified Streptomyces TaxID=2593676 RepID=UPI003819131C